MIMTTNRTMYSFEMIIDNRVFPPKCQFPLLIYCLMGTSKQLSLGPDALSSLLVGLILPKIDEASHLLFPLFSFLTGLLLLMFGILRIGFLDNILSKPLLAGFVNAVAITIMIEQVDIMLGLPSSGLHGWSKVANVWKDRQLINWITVGLGAFFVSLLMLIRILKRHMNGFKYVPETLVVVVLGIVTMHFSNLEGKGVTVLGPTPSGFSWPTLPAFELLTGPMSTTIFGNVTIISVIGFIEHIVITKIFSNKYNYQVSPNRELVALGCSNIFGSFFCTYPTFGSLPRSAVADGLGARSQIFTFVVCFVLLFTILFASPLFHHLPHVVMGSIICVASVGLFKFGDVQFLWQIRAWTELIMLISTFLLTLILGIEIGVLLSLAISILLIVRKTTYPHITIMGYQPAKTSFVEISAVNSRILPGIIIVRIEDPLYFANITHIKTLFSRIERLGDPKAHPSLKDNGLIRPTRAIIIHLRNVLSIDASAIYVLKQMLINYESRDVCVRFVKLRESLVKPFILAGILTNEDDVSRLLYNNLHDAVISAQRHIYGCDTTTTVDHVHPTNQTSFPDSKPLANHIIITRQNNKPSSFLRRFKRKFHRSKEQICEMESNHGTMGDSHSLSLSSMDIQNYDNDHNEQMESSSHPYHKRPISKHTILYVPSPLRRLQNRHRSHSQTSYLDRTPSIHQRPKGVDSSLSRSAENKRSCHHPYATRLPISAIGHRHHQSTDIIAPLPPLLVDSDKNTDLKTESHNFQRKSREKAVTRTQLHASSRSDVGNDIVHDKLTHHPLSSSDHEVINIEGTHNLITNTLHRVQTFN